MIARTLLWSAGAIAAAFVVACGGELSSGSGGGGASPSSGSGASTSSTGGESAAGGGNTLVGGMGGGGGTTSAHGPAVVELGAASSFVALAKSGISTVPQSALTGDIGVSPIDSTAMTGFSFTLDPSGTFATSTQIVGKAYAADYTSPTPSNLTVAVGAMETAYTDAAGRTTPDFVELGSGELGGLTLAPGLYKWGTGVLITTDVTLTGGPDDVWIFQISGGITQASSVKVLLSGGARPKNIFWQAAGAVALDTSAHMEGIVLAQTQISLATDASANGRLFSQTAVSLDHATVVQPAP